MSNILKIILAANIVAIAMLVFLYPNFMVAPGKLIQGHQQLESDCFACHAPFAGAVSERCVACHKPAEIGQLTTTGQVIAKPLKSAPFHQKLTRQGCLSCHSDHVGIQRSQHQGHFNHALLDQALRDRCQDCHVPPTDLLHQQMTGDCNQCHNQDKWLPTSFDHSLYFLLDGDHNALCASCHVNNDFSRYTCYGCHEHTPAKIRNEHIEEGISDFDHCVQCHRSANKHDIGARNGKNEIEEDD